MTQIIKGHNVAYLKRLAKTIKKQNNFTHHQSLDKVALDIGFNNWKHFLNSKKISTKSPTSKSKIVANSLSQTKTIDPYRNLLVAAINELIVHNHISLIPTIEYPNRDSGHVILSLFGQTSVIIWDNNSSDELQIVVWWKYNHNKHPQADVEGIEKEDFSSEYPLADRTAYKNFVGVITSGWLERRSGKFLQGENKKRIMIYYTRKGELQNLKELPAQKPKGYKATGRSIS